MLLVRSRAWWHNKVPLSVLMFLLLVDRQPFTLSTFAALVGLLCAVCSVANYGYGLNELFDREEDNRSGRSNVANTVSIRRMWAIIAVSAAIALGTATVIAGSTGSLLTTGELLLPLAYSSPPLRTKERGWSGVFCDALAAHVYPAMLALAIVSYQELRSPSRHLLLAVGTWSLMTGLRGILSHQLQSEEHDLGAGLRTVVHRLGHNIVSSLVTFAILPVEVTSFVAVVLQLDVTPAFYMIASVFLLYEMLKFKINAFPALVFTRNGQHYVPFVDEGFYKVWGPLALTIDASISSALYLPLIPLYLLCFRPRTLGEWGQMRATGEMVRLRIGRFLTQDLG